VAKRADGRYEAGQREWLKVKRRRTVDCVVIDVAGDMTRPWLVLGLRHADGEYHHAGLARCSKGRLGDELASILAPSRSRGKPDPLTLAARGGAGVAPRATHARL